MEFGTCNNDEVWNNKYFLKLFGLRTLLYSLINEDPKDLLLCGLCLLVFTILEMKMKAFQKRTY